jgi:hypothetical protein
MAGLDDAASELESIARHLRRAGEGQLVTELTRAIRRAVEPVKGEIIAGLKPRLPDPYASVLASDLNLQVSVSASERDPRVTLSAQAAGISGAGRRTLGRRRILRLNGGLLEHPLFGDKSHWYKQPVGPQFFSGPARDARPRVRRAIEQALYDVSYKAASKGP